MDLRLQHPAKSMPPTRRSSSRNNDVRTSPRRLGVESIVEPLSAPATTAFRNHLARFQLSSQATTNRTSSADSEANAKFGNESVASIIKDVKSKTLSRPKTTRKSSKYAAPSRYAHLQPLVDILEPNLICVFVGTNPGIRTATAGHAYAHPSNHFWKLLYASGLTSRRLAPEEDRSLPALYCMGNTNIVERPSKDAAELSKEEMSAGTAVLDAKFLEYKPEAVCIVGKGIWEAIWRYRYAKNLTKSDFKYGWQDEEHNMGRSPSSTGGGEASNEGWNGSRVFVATSTSGLAANLKPAEKEAIWKPFGEWVQRRRQERGFKSENRSCEVPETS